MRALAGCRSCGHVELVDGEAEAGEEVGACPRCGGPFRGVGLLGAHLLAQAMRRKQANARVDKERAVSKR
jgi:hypothetical protein